jgi:hypothetical protein
MSPRRSYVATVAIFAESLNPNLNPYPPAVAVTFKVILAWTALIWPTIIYIF